MDDAKPWDILNPNTEYVKQDVFDKRYDLCKGCESFLKATKRCSICSCVMPIKAKIKHAACPSGKW